MHIKKWIGHLRRWLYYIHHKQFLQVFEDRSLAQAQPVFYKRKRVNVMYITNTFAIFRRLVSTHTGTWVAWKSKLCRKFAAGFSTTAGTMGAGEGRVPWTSGAIKAISTTAHTKQYHQRGGLKRFQIDFFSRTRRRAAYLCMKKKRGQEPLQHIPTLLSS